MLVKKISYGTWKYHTNSYGVAKSQDRATDQVAANFATSPDRQTLQVFVTDSTEPEATDCKDGASAYEGLPRTHEAVKHSVTEYVRGKAATNGVESC